MSDFLRWTSAAVIGTTLFNFAILRLPPPANAPVIIDQGLNKFMSPQCAMRKRSERALFDPDGKAESYAQLATFGKARDEHATPDPVCMTLIGILQPAVSRIWFGSRWSDNGEWRW